MIDSESRTMPSSTPQISKKPRRLAKYLVGGLVVLGVIYTAGWYYLARELEARVTTNIAAFKERGIDATCENARASGFPMRVGLDCTKVGWADKAKNLSVTAGSFRSAAQLYDPLRINSTIEGPAAIDLPGIMPLDAKWEELTSSIRLDRPLPREITIEGRNVAVNGRDASATQIAVIADGQLNFRANEPQMDVALTFNKLKLADNVIQNRSLPELTGAADIQLANGFALLGKAERDLTVLHGQSGTLRKVDLSFNDGSGVGITGPFSVADDGRISGEFQVTMRDPEGFAKAIQGIVPEAGNTISTVLQALAFAPRDATGAPTLPITVKNGKMSVGFISIGRLPAL
ncbi:MAG: DUF2125 domain-containing protein [Phyllobacterium sp.]|uniref:DUF2125 domain-containing protein n=1 Tax=Phyllobacterium sp. TaxID=1871046 RepID=UPI0030F262EB